VGGRQVAHGTQSGAGVIRHGVGGDERAHVTESGAGVIAGIVRRHGRLSLLAACQILTPRTVVATLGARVSSVATPYVDSLWITCGRRAIELEIPRG
jgi:hypothetical protein